MLAILSVFIFILGVVLGSFVNALVYRIENKMTIKGRSMCPSCKHQLEPVDLVPVFSWLFLRGKCRYCHKRISAQYPVVEALTGFAALAIAYAFGLNQVAVGLLSPTAIFIAFVMFWLAAIAVLSVATMVVALYDYRTGYVLSYYVYAAMLAAAVLIAVKQTGLAEISSILPFIYCSLGAALPIALLWLVSRGKWMGAGDIEVAALLGLVLGWPATVVGMYFCFIIGSVVGVALVATKKSKPGSEISLAPFLVAGLYFGLVFGQQVAELYVRMFL